MFSFSSIFYTPYLLERWNEEEKKERKEGGGSIHVF